MATRADDQVHFDLSMSRSANTAIEHIAAGRGTTASDIIARAITLFVEVDKHLKDGQTVGVLDADKRPVVEFTGV